MRKEFLELLPEVEIFKNDSFRLYINQTNKIVLLTAYGEEINLGKQRPIIFDFKKETPRLFSRMERAKTVNPFAPLLVKYRTGRFEIAVIEDNYIIYELDEDASDDLTNVFKIFKELGKAGR